MLCLATIFDIWSSKNGFAREKYEFMEDHYRYSRSVDTCLDRLGRVEQE